MGALIFLFLSLLALILAGILSSVLVATASVTLGIGATTMAVLSLRE